MYNPIVNNYIYKKLLTFMVPKQYLTGFTPSVRVSGGTYIVDYEIGECVYTYQRVGRRIKQEVLQLIKCDMWKVITLINEGNKLNESDYQDINMEIRNHSLHYVTEFINERGLHQQYYSSTT
jgi:hypothetical protein